MRSLPVPPTSSFGLLTGTREHSDVARAAEHVRRRAGLADRRRRGHDVVVAGPAVDLVGSLASSEHVVRGAAVDDRLLGRGRRGGDEVAAVGAVDRVRTGAGVDRVGVGRRVSRAGVALTEGCVGAGVELVVGRSALHDVAAGTAHEDGALGAVQRLLGRGSTCGAGLDAGRVREGAVVRGADGVRPTVAGQTHLAEAGRDLVRTRPRRVRRRTGSPPSGRSAWSRRAHRRGSSCLAWRGRG